MVAVALLAVAIASLFQLFSISLRSAVRAGDYTRAIFHARSMLDEAYSLPDVTKDQGEREFEDGFKGTRQVVLKSASEDGSVKLYEITVTVTWSPKGRLTLNGSRTVYDAER